MKFVKAKMCIFVFLLCTMQDALFPMKFQGYDSLQEQVLDRLSELDNLAEAVQQLSMLPPLPPEFLKEGNVFLLHKNLFFCRSIIFNFLALTQRHVSILSEIPNSEMQNVQPLIAQKTLCKNGRLYTACTNGFLSSLDMQSKVQIIKRGMDADAAFACIKVKDQILATAQVNSNIIQLWKFDDLTELGNIQTQIPTANIEIIRDLLIVLDTAGDIDFYSWPDGKKLCHLRTGISDMIVDVAWHKRSKCMFITTTKDRYMISLEKMIIADQLLHSLSLNQLMMFAYVLKNCKEIVPGKLLQDETFKSFPSLIKEMIVYIFNFISHIPQVDNL